MSACAAARALVESTVKEDAMAIALNAKATFN